MTGVSGPSTRDVNHNTMEKTAQVFLFGDQTIPFEHTLHNLLHVKDDGMLAAFYDKLAFHLRRYLGNLPTYQQDWFPYCTTLIDLVAEYDKLRGAPVLKFALLCTSEIAQFIRSRSPYGTIYGTFSC
jgi:naphtho-gamma-pyrone polyketide synthase